jgi:hypothetical protein
MIHETRKMIHETKIMHRQLDDITIPGEVWSVMLFLHDVVHKRLGTVFVEIFHEGYKKRRNYLAWLWGQGFCINLICTNLIETQKELDLMDESFDLCFWKRIDMNDEGIRDLPFDTLFATKLDVKTPYQLWLWCSKFHHKTILMTHHSKLYKNKSNLQRFAKSILKWSFTEYCSYKFYLKRISDWLPNMPRVLVSLIGEFFWSFL